MVTLAELPQTVTLVPMPASIASVRGGTPGQSSAAAFRVPVSPDAGDASVELTSAAYGSVSICVRLSPQGGRTCTVQLRSAEPGDSDLLGAETGRPHHPILFRQVPPGTYVLDVVRHDALERTRVHLRIDPAD
jgi:hypothetical protein